MTQFETSRWAESEFSQNYRDAASIFLPFRRQFIEVATSIFGYFISENPQAHVLDLGCGDGLFVQELLKSFTPAKVRLVDGSNEMLEAAMDRLRGEKNLFFTQASFQNLLAKDPMNESFDFIYSSLAIHHLPFEEKRNLYAYIYDHLSPGGLFVHYDVVVPPSEKIEKFYLSIWRQWIAAHPAIEKNKKLVHVPEEYKENKDNVPDTLDSQLSVLTEIGFKEVDCYFKFGVFSLFGGFK